MRSISEIAQDIKAEWKNPYFGAKPYLQAMLSLNDKSDFYGMDSAKEIVVYFLANASTFRGGNAAALKSELKAIIK